jgi:heat shock protein HslJ
LFLAAPEPATAVEPAQDLMAQEQEFLRALQTATTWKIVRGMLDVHRADGERVLTASEAGK